MRVPIPLLPRVVRWAGVAVIAGFIFYASILTAPPATPVDDAQPWFLDLSYWRHLVAYATLALTLAYATDEWSLERWRHALVVIAVVTLYGAGIEVGQWFVPERHFDLADIAVNALGASVVLGWFALRPRLEVLEVEAFVDRLGSRG